MKIKRAVALFRGLVAMAIFVLLIAMRILMSQDTDSFLSMSICILISFMLLGASAAVKMNFFKCPHCKSDLDDPHALYCQSCGNKIDN